MRHLLSGFIQKDAHSFPSCGSPSVPWLTLRPVARPQSHGSPSVPWLAPPHVQVLLLACTFTEATVLVKLPPVPPPLPQPEAVLGVWTPAVPWGLGCARAVMFCDLSSCINQTGLTQRCVFFPPFHSRSPVNILEKNGFGDLFFKTLKKESFYLKKK